MTAMDIVSRLNDELLRQDFAGERHSLEEYERFRLIAQGYASIENALVVLSDMRTDNSDIYYGGFSRILGLHADNGGHSISSIWEEDILKHIHPDDLNDKYLLELRFFNFVKHLPRSRRSECYLVEKLRMRDAHGNYLPVLHRMFYLSTLSGRSIRFALCLYTPLLYDVASGGCVVDAVSGQTLRLEKRTDMRILSERERQVLRLIDRGMMSKHIADTLSISINTVNRHRQGILQKLKVKNSIEACRIAKNLGII